MGNINIAPKSDVRVTMEEPSVPPETDYTYLQVWPTGTINLSYQNLTLKNFPFSIKTLNSEFHPISSILKGIAQLLYVLHEKSIN